MKKCTGMIISLILCAHAQAESFNPNTRYPAVSLLNITAPACTTYTPLPANSVPSAENAYQIANKIWGEKEVGLYTHMYQLGEQAAKAGHLQAMYLMAILYTRKKQNIGFYDYAEFKPEEALNYLNILMQKGYSDAFYLMAQIRNTSVIKTPTPASFFLNRAMELGSPDAWMSVAQYHIERRDTPKAKPFYTMCGSEWFRASVKHAGPGEKFECKHPGRLGAGIQLSLAFGKKRLPHFI
jgi:hypothetical protein